MIQPLVALLALGTLTLLSVLLFRPERGFFWRGLRALRANERVRIEDALKHVHDCEYHRNPCTLNSVAGALGLAGNKTALLLARLEELGLVRSRGGAIELTAEGRGSALRVIRIHRLWERYLSEETGLAAPEWHSEAEEREHRTSPEQAAELAALTGYPRFDPHGDPIPTESGEILPSRGRPLTDLPAGERAEIVHVEDEPPSVYAQLVAQRLHPGVHVRVTEVTTDRITFEADAQEHVLAPVVAANLWVVPLLEEEGRQEELEGPFERMSSLQVGEPATVLGISAACRGMERRRLLDLGIVPGTRVVAEMRSPSGDPTAYRIRGAMIALRGEQADLIHVQRLNDGVAA